MKILALRRVALAVALGLAAYLAAPSRAHAQSGTSFGPLGGYLPPCGYTGCSGYWHLDKAVFPRTYSYLYQQWFNQPCHFRYTGPNGCTYWGVSVRGLPLGTPWPSY